MVFEHTSQAETVNWLDDDDFENGLLVSLKSTEPDVDDDDYENGGVLAWD